MRRESILLSIALAFIVLGCSFGDAPKGLSPEGTRAAVAALPPQQQIDYINRSPLPPDEKQKRIAAIKSTHGMK